MAEKVRSRRARVMPIPDAMPFEEAAALLMTYGTSYHALKQRAELQAPARACWCSAPRAASARRRSNWARRWARASSPPLRRGKGRCREKLGRRGGARLSRGPFDRRRGARSSPTLQGRMRREGRGRHLRLRRRRLLRGGAARDRVGRALPRHRFPAGHRQDAAQFALLKGCQMVGVFWGDFPRATPKPTPPTSPNCSRFTRDGTIRPRAPTGFRWRTRARRSPCSPSAARWARSSSRSHEAGKRGRIRSDFRTW